MNFVSWNCRGLDNSTNAEAVNDLIRMASPNVLKLQETKIDEESLLSISSKSWKLNVGKAVSSRGIAHGIATLWTENDFILEYSHKSQHWIFTQLCHIPSKKVICLFNLYVLVNLQEI